MQIRITGRSIALSSTVLEFTEGSMLRKALLLLSSVALFVAAPVTAHAQQASGIAGAVRDTSGAVLQFSAQVNV